MVYLGSIVLAKFSSSFPPGIDRAHRLQSTDQLITYIYLQMPLKSVPPVKLYFLTDIIVCDDDDDIRSVRKHVFISLFLIFAQTYKSD